MTTPPDPHRPRPASGRATHGAREDWQAVAVALNTRMATIRITQTDLARRANVSVATLRVLQRGTGQRRTTDATLAAVSRALGWPDRYLLQILLQPPTAAVSPEPDPLVPPAAGDPPASASLADILSLLRRIEDHVAAIAGHLATSPQAAHTP
ncbi:hypothetical protein UG55_111129 [Frankia sp. EI5c]|nr:hypothetical protein UG55_111129 [Frankia sp. EI5c]